MESLEYFRSYIERFQQLNFNDFSHIYNLLYPSYDNLQNRIEFSLLLDQDSKFDLRFGLFGLYDTQKISSLLREMGYKSPNLERILISSKDFVPEFAVGFDFNQSNPRIKIYLLRLLDNPEFNKNPIEKIIMLSNLVDIDLTNINEDELKHVYLLAIDFYRANKYDLKIYTRDLNVDFSRINTYLKKRGINPHYLKVFQEIFHKGELNDVTISKKYSSDLNLPSDLSVFFESTDNLNVKIEQLIKACIPQKIIDLKETIRPLEKTSQVRYSHIGLTFSENKIRESICLYFSPLVEEIKK